METQEILSGNMSKCPLILGKGGRLRPHWLGYAPHGTYFIREIAIPSSLET